MLYLNSICCLYNNMYICIFLIMLQSSLLIARREMSDTSMQKNKK